MRTVPIAVILAAGLLAAGCALRSQSPADAAQARQAEALRSVCGTADPGVAARRLEAGATPEPHDCRQMLLRPASPSHL